MKSGQCFGAMAVVALSGLAHADLVTNSGFENGAGITATGWNLIQAPGPNASATAERATVSPLNGSFHLRLAVQGADGAGALAEAQFQTALFSVTPGNAYDLSLFARSATDIGPGVVAGYEIQWLDSDGSNGGGVKGSSGFVGFAGLTSSYSSFSILNSVAAADSDAALVIIRLVAGAFPASNGSIFADDVTLTAVPAPGAAALLGVAALTVGRRRR